MMQGSNLNICIHCLFSVMTLDPNYVGAYFYRGAIYTEKDPERAIKDFSHVIKLDPSHAVSLYARGDIYFTLNKFEEAIEDFDRAIQLNPNDTDSYYKRGIAHAKKKKTDIYQAKEDLKEVLRLDPNYPNAKKDLDTIYELWNLQKKTLLESGNSLSNQYLDQGKYNEAIETCTMTLKLDPDDTMSYLLRSYGYINTEKYKNAEDDLNTLLVLIPNHPVAMQLLEQVQKLNKNQEFINKAKHDINSIEQNRFNEKERIERERCSEQDKKYREERERCDAELQENRKIQKKKEEIEKKAKERRYNIGRISGAYPKKCVNENRLIFTYP